MSNEINHKFRTMTPAQLSATVSQETVRAVRFYELIALGVRGSYLVLTVLALVVISSAFYADFSDPSTPFSPLKAQILMPSLFILLGALVTVTLTKWCRTRTLALIYRDLEQSSNKGDGDA